jgi:dimethylglycine dehydrogenase
VFGSGIAENYHLRWFEAQLPREGVRIRSLRNEMLGFAIAGPQSRALLQKLTGDDVSAAALAFLAFRRMNVAMVPAWVGRISFSGELGYEIWVPVDAQRSLYLALVEAGRDFGLRRYGARALHCMRLEKSFGNWAREYRPIYTPREAGLERFVAIDKGDFVGREAVLRERETELRRRLVTLVVDATQADAGGDEPVWHAGKVVGWVTSGGYGHVVKQSIALAYIPAGLVTDSSQDRFEVEILGERCRARLVTEPLYDPRGVRMRS